MLRLKYNIIKYYCFYNSIIVCKLKKTKFVFQSISLNYIRFKYYEFRCTSNIILTTACLKKLNLNDSCFNYTNCVSCFRIILM